MQKRIVLWSVALLLLAMVPTAIGQQRLFLGRWNIAGQGAQADRVYWLEVKDSGGKLTAMFLNRGGSPVPVENLTIEGDELTFSLPAGRGGRPTPMIRLKASNDKVTGTVKAGDETVNVAGFRPPTWGSDDANARHTFGKPVELFSGKSLDAWTVQVKDRPMGWTIADGAMTNQPPANNLVSKQKFLNFKIEAEYKLQEKSNSGIYLRGRYELQVLDDFGTEPESHGHMAIYSRKAPATNASKRAGEWQSMEATIVGNRVTVLLNGKKVHDNAVIEGITGGALDINETEPGPIMIQGDHEKVWYRKVTVTPIQNAK